MGGAEMNMANYLVKVSEMSDISVESWYSDADWKHAWWTVLAKLCLPVHRYNSCSALLTVFHGAVTPYLLWKNTNKLLQQRFRSPNRGIGFIWVTAVCQHLRNVPGVFSLAVTSFIGHANESLELVLKYYFSSSLLSIQIFCHKYSVSNFSPN